MIIMYDDVLETSLVRLRLNLGTDGYIRGILNVRLYHHPPQQANT